MIKEEEVGTAPLRERIEAASKCQEKGYPLGFHFDPLIYHEGWEKEYQGTIDQLFKKNDPKRVVWISLGGFRYPPKLKAVAEDRFPKNQNIS